MATRKNFRVGLIVEGDGKGGVKAIKASRAELDRLARSTKNGTARGKEMSRVYRRLNRDIGAGIRNASLLGIALGGLAARSVIKATIEQERAVTQLEAALKSTGGVAGFTSQELQDFASQLQRTTTFGDEAILGMQSVLLTFTNLRDDVLPGATEAVLNVSTRMGTDLKSSALQVGKALNDPIRGLDGLNRAGIQFTDDQKETIKQLAETGRVADAQRLILSELETQFGGAAAAARDTFGGALTGVKNAFGDLLEADGGGLLDVQAALNELEETLTDPETVRGAQELTGALIDGFSTLIRLLARVPDFGRDLGETVAELIVGSDDPLERTREKIAEIQSQIQQLQSVPEVNIVGGGLGAGFAAASGLATRYAGNLEDLQAELDELLQVEQELLDLQNNAPPRAKEIDDETEARDENAEAAKRQRDAKAALAAIEDEETVKIREQIDALREQVALARSGVDVDEARQRVQLAGQGFTEQQIDDYIRLNKALQQFKQDQKDATAAEQDAAKVRQELHNRTAERIEGIYFDVARSIPRGFDAAADQVLDSFQTLLADLILEAGRNQILIPLVAQAGSLLGVGEDFLAGTLKSLASGDLAKEIGKETAGGVIDSAKEIGTEFAKTAGPIIAGAIGTAALFKAGQFLASSSDLDPRVAGGAVAIDPVISPQILALDNLLGGAIFGSGRSLRSSELDLGFGQDVTATSRTTVRESGGLLSGADYIRSQTDLPELAAEVAAAFQPTLDVLARAGETFGIDLAGISLELSESIKGKTDEEVAEIVSNMLSEAGDRLATTLLPNIEEFQRGGEGLVDTLSRLVTQTDAVTLAYERLGFTLEQTPLFDENGPLAFLNRQIEVNNARELAELADVIVEAAGGLERFGRGVQTFIDEFLPESEQLEILTGDVTRVLQQIGAELPPTREGFVALLQSLGPEAQGILLGNIGLFDDYYDTIEQGGDSVQAATRDLEAFNASLEDLRNSLRRQLVDLTGGSVAAFDINTILGALGSAESPEAILGLLGQLQTALTAQFQEGRQAIEEQRQAALEAARDELEALEDVDRARIEQLELEAAGIEDIARSASRLRDLARQIGDFSIGLGFDAAVAPGTPMEQLAAAQQEFFRQTNLARGGDTTAAGNLTGLADTVLALARDVFASGAEFQAIFQTVRGSLSSTASQIDDTAPDLQRLDDIRGEIELLREQAGIDTESINATFDAQIQDLKEALIGQLAGISGVLDDVAALSSAAPDEVPGLLENIRADIVAAVLGQTDVLGGLGQSQLDRLLSIASGTDNLVTLDDMLARLAGIATNTGELIDLRLNTDALTALGTQQRDQLLNILADTGALSGIQLSAQDIAALSDTQRAQLEAIRGDTSELFSLRLNAQEIASLSDTQRGLLWDILGDTDNLHQVRLSTSDITSLSAQQRDRLNEILGDTAELFQLRINTDALEGLSAEQRDRLNLILGGALDIVDRTAGTANNIATLGDQHLQQAMSWNTAVLSAINSTLASHPEMDQSFPSKSGMSTGGMQTYAHGGIATEPSIFGEAGPEAAVPLPDGRTIPVTISGASNEGLIREIRQLRAEVAELREAANATANNTGQTAHNINRQTEEMKRAGRRPTDTRRVA